MNTALVLWDIGINTGAQVNYPVCDITVPNPNGGTQKKLVHWDEELYPNEVPSGALEIAQNYYKLGLYYDAVARGEVADQPPFPEATEAAGNQYADALALAAGNPNGVRSSSVAAIDGGLITVEDASGVIVFAVVIPPMLTDDYDDFINAALGD